MKYLNKCQSNIPTLTNEDGIEAITGAQKADMLNSFFSKCFNYRSAPLRIEDNPFLDPFPGSSSNRALLLRRPGIRVALRTRYLKIKHTRQYFIKDVKVNSFLLYWPISHPDDFLAVQSDINMIKGWSDEHLLQLNPTKCKYTRFCLKRSPQYRTGIPYHWVALC